jgi:hypothetical protein
MGSKRQQRWELFKLLTLVDAKQGVKILKTVLAKEQTTLIAELAANLLAGNIKLNKIHKIKLFGKKVLIRKLAAEGASHKTRLAIIRKNTKAVLEILGILLKSI